MEATQTGQNRNAAILLAAFVVATACAGVYSARFPNLAASSTTTSGSESSYVAPTTKRGTAGDLSSAMEGDVPDVQPSEGLAGHPLYPLLHYAQELRDRIESEVHDYTATLVKRERIDGALGAETQMQLKIRNRNEATATPLSVYLRFEKPSSSKGREVIWVESLREGRLIAHEAGFLNLRSVELEPDGMLAMMGNKYPISEIGLLRLVEKLIEKGERDRAIGDCKVEVFDEQKVGDRNCRLFQVTHPRSQSGYDFHIAQVYVDTERGIPLRYAAYMWPKNPSEAPPLEEEYTYLDVAINVGLTDADFDPENEAYQYP